MSSPLFILAPMDDVTDTVFRRIVASCAAPDLFFTEFVNVDGLQSKGKQALMPKLQFTDAETPIIAQIWGKVPENYYKTTLELVEMGFAGVDVNMGCPEKNIVRNGCCSGLINNRDLAIEIIKAVQRGIKDSGKKIPVSVKTRLGFHQNDFTWHELLLRQDLDMLTIHGRTTKEMSKVPARWVDIAHVRAMRDEIAPETKIVGNGDVLTRQQGEELAQKYKLDGIMIGRGIFQDPYVFAQNSPWANFSEQARIELLKKHVELFTATWQNGERRFDTLKKFAKVYISDFDGAKELREKLMSTKTPTELLALL